ncbi:hypothetical protein J1TS5_34600 [Paenibacillus macerans]|nr:hypothetical protein J1TS5_34600 [Paenibacillus macerans]
MVSLIHSTDREFSLKLMKATGEINNEANSRIQRRNCKTIVLVFRISQGGSPVGSRNDINGY